MTDFFMVLAGAIFIDFLLNGGYATGSVFRAIGSIFHGEEETVVKASKSEETQLRDKIDELTEELDELNEELADADDEKERQMISKKIERREKIMQVYIGQLTYKNNGTR